MVNHRIAHHYRDYDAVKKVQYDFCARDSKGRWIGSRIERVTTHYSTEDEGGSILAHGVLPTGRAVHEDGVYFEYRSYATRDRRDYGAHQGWRAFKTEAEREAAIQKYLDGAQKRANKKAGR